MCVRRCLFLLLFVLGLCMLVCLFVSVLFVDVPRFCGVRVSVADACSVLCVLLCVCVFVCFFCLCFSVGVFVGVVVRGLCVAILRFSVNVVCVAVPWCFGSNGSPRRQVLLVATRSKEVCVSFLTAY